MASSKDSPPNVLELQTEVSKWQKDLSQVESKLSGFEQDIIDHESTLAALLNKCNDMLTKLEEEIPGDGHPGNEDSDDNDDDKELEEQLKRLGQELTGSKCNSTERGEVNPKPLFSLKLKEEPAFVESQLQACGLSDGCTNTGSLCEFCGTLIDEKEDFESHRIHCLQPVTSS